MAVVDGVAVVPVLPELGGEGQRFVGAGPGEPEVLALVGGQLGRGEAGEPLVGVLAGGQGQLGLLEVPFPVPGGNAEDARHVVGDPEAEKPHGDGEQDGPEP